MENLLALFNKIQQVSPLSLFASETIIVQNAGMQHWLNMTIAQQRGIAMSMSYALPAQFLWKLMRTMAGDDEVVEQSPYSREVLTWRIFTLLALPKVKNDADFSTVTHYWCDEKQLQQQDYKRYQLSQKIADLYEQYLIFRPEWIDAWCQQHYKNEELLLGDTIWSRWRWRKLRVAR